MKIQIKVVESIIAYNKELNRKIAKGALNKEQGIVMTPETFNKVFSPERIKLLQRLNKNNISNIYQLAKELNKPYEVVFRNIKYLEGIGLIKVKRKNNKNIPCLSGELKIDMLSNNNVNVNV